MVIVQLEDHSHPQALVLPGHHRASVVGTGTAQLRFLLFTLLVDMKHDATDRFMRDTVGCCHYTERLFLVHHTMHYCRPVFSRNTVIRVFWPWSPFANNRKRAGVMCFFGSEHLLYLEIQLASRSKEEVENW
jgi:hypothetical protein